MTRRLILSYLAATLVVLVLLEVPFGLFYAQRERDQLRSDVERDALVISTLYKDALATETVPDPAPAERYAKRTGARVVVVGLSGISVVDTEQPTSRDLKTRPEIKIALSGEHAIGTRDSKTLRTELLYVAVPVTSGGVIHGALRITLDTSDVDAHIQRFWWGLAAIAVVVLAAMALVGWLIARSVSTPLRRLTTTARQFGSGDFSDAPTESEGPPELRELSETMRTMAQQLDALLDEQRAFVADASHQLRTPLTGLRLRLENLQANLNNPSSSSGGIATSDGAQIDAAIDEIARLSSIVTDLLQLARADRHQPTTQQDLTTITQHRLDTWTAVAEQAGIRLQLHNDASSLMVLAVPGAIEQILDNTLDNAISIAPSNTTVTVSLEAGSTYHRLTIRDEGPGLNDEEKAQAVRRFWRGDQRRPGSGLGLPIAASLARASGGSLTLEDAPGGGLLVVVDFRLGLLR